MTDTERIMTRLNDLESLLRDVQNWRDPRNTQARIETIAGNLDNMTRAVGQLTCRVKEIEVRQIPCMVVETEPQAMCSATEPAKPKRAYTRRSKE